MDRRKIVRRALAAVAALGVSQVVQSPEIPAETSLEPLGPFPVEGGPQYSAGEGQRWMVAGEHILNGDPVCLGDYTPAQGVPYEDRVYRMKVVQGKGCRPLGIAVNTAHRGTPVKVTIWGVARLPGRAK